jgi:hypothetical protein
MSSTSLFGGQYGSHRCVTRPVGVDSNTNFIQPMTQMNQIGSFASPVWVGPGGDALRLVRVMWGGRHLLDAVTYLFSGEFCTSAVWRPRAFPAAMFLSLSFQWLEYLSACGMCSDMYRQACYTVYDMCSEMYVPYVGSV